MKYRILTILLLLLLTGALEAQWMPIAGGAGSLYGVHFPTTSIGYIAGDFGSMRKSTDGGDSWAGQTSGTADDLYSVFFTSATTGYACGDNGTIIKTTDGGAQWNTLTTSTTNLLMSISFADANNGIAAGMGGSLLRTTNAGATWTSTGASISEKYFSVCAPSTSNAVAVGFSGMIRRSTNGGSLWFLVPSGGTHVLSGVHFADANNGIIVGDANTILKTMNGGSSWTPINSGFTYDLVSVFCVDASTVYAVGNQGTIMKTTDAGATWTNQASGTGNLLQGVFFSNANLGWAVGQTGTILKTTNGGMPVELASFSATVSGATVDLRWATASETNNFGFAIERQDRQRGRTWEQVGFVQGHGTTKSAQTYRFSDNPAASGMYAYRLKQTDLDGSFEYSSEQVASIGARATELGQNYPNPVTTSASISYTLAEAAPVTLAIYDALGRLVRTLADGVQVSGTHSVVFDRGTLAAGTYTYRLSAGGRTMTKLLLLN